MSAATDPAADWVSLTAADLLVSLRVPRGWEGSVPDPFSLVVRDAAADGALAPTLTVQQGRPEEPGHEWFVDFAAELPGRLQRDLDGFELIGTERFRLSSSYADVLMVSARLAEDDQPATAQVQAYAWVSGTRMYVIGGSTLLEHEERDLPLFTAMVHSLRLLPPRPGG